jgi:signal transduction histidine kinase
VAALYVIRGADEGKRFELSAPVLSIGRDANNAIWLHDTEVSRRHAELHAQPGGGHKLIDLGSSNGTAVNNQNVTEVVLQPGDQILLGSTLLVYVAVNESPRRADLANRISVISRAGQEAPSAIVRTISEDEGSRLLARPLAAEGPWLKNALGSLSVIYQTTLAVSHILDIDQLLEKIMDLLFDCIEADRGCIMLRLGEGTKFEPKVIRYRDGVDRGEQITISRTITDYVLKEQKGVLVSDARQDERFAPAQSVQRYGIREAICVPMKGRHETVGVLYLDTQVRSRNLAEVDTKTTKLTDEHLMLAVAIGHLAGMAVEETRYYQAMVQAERLAAIGQTIAAISHHIKNILQGLQSGGDLIKLGLDDQNLEMARQGWAIMHKNQGKIYDLVLDMLNFSKEREPVLEETALPVLVKEVLELALGRRTDRPVKVETRFDSHLVTVLADAEGLHRALLNVVSNALDAVAEVPEPRITVETHGSADGKWAEIIVADNGCGIPPEKLAEIFKPFVSSKGSRGTGLGLTVTRKILREHGGDVLVQSTPGQGSRFTLRLPAAPTPEPIRKTTLQERPGSDA